MLNLNSIICLIWAWGSVGLRRCATNQTISGSIHRGVTLGIFSIATDGTMCPGVDSASKNEYQGFILGGEGGRCVRLTTYHPCSAERQENPGP
jgi:hypothetical protein